MENVSYDYYYDDQIKYINENSESVIQDVCNVLDKAQNGVCEFSKILQGPTPDTGIDKIYDDFLQLLSSEYELIAGADRTIDAILEEANNIKSAIE